MKKLSHTGGFTLVEILIVLALIVIIGKFALMISFDTYRGASYHTDRSYFVAVLEHARTLSIDDVCEGSACTGGMPHGVSIQNNRYVMFQGTKYSARDPSLDEITEANPSIIRSGLSEIVFAPGSGNVLQAGDIILTDPSGRTSTITIGAYGQILWTN